jgi:hypothetical protein
LTRRSDHDQLANQQEATEPLSGSSTAATNLDHVNPSGHGLEQGEWRDAHQALPQTSTPPDQWRLNPQRMPRRITLELPEPLLAELLALAERQGRCLDEIALDLIETQLHGGFGS